jgi:hypothetical protein
VKFGRDNYGYGLGNIEVRSFDPSETQTSFTRTRQAFPIVKTVDPLDLAFYQRH